MKVFISFDFEGIGGITSFTETENPKWQIEATNQLLAFCDGICETDKDARITICDSHAKGGNILWELLPQNVTLVKGYPRNRYMVEGLDNSYDHLVLFGYHTSIGTQGVMDHTYSGGSIAEIKVNNFILDEGTINASLAAELNVPLSMIFGDDKTIDFYNSNFNLSDVETVVSKKAISRFAASLISRDELYHKLR